MSRKLKGAAAVLLGVQICFAGNVLAAPEQAAPGTAGAVKAIERTAGTEDKTIVNTDASARVNKEPSEGVSRFDDKYEMHKVRLTWNPVPGAVRYQLVILRDANDTPDNIVSVKSYIFTTGYELDTSMMRTEKNGYYWKVCALNIDGKPVGKFSVPQPLKNGEINTLAPLPTTQYNSMPYAPLYPVYSWIPYSKAAGYDIEVYRRSVTPGKADALIAKLHGRDSNYYDEGGYTYPGTYWWHVRAVDGSGRPISEWSKPREFQVTSPVKVAAFGDSVTHGGGAVCTPPSYLLYDWETYSAVPIKNLGYSGNTVEAMIERFERDVLPFKPKILVIMGGVNNYRSGDTAWSIIHSLAVLRDKCKAHGIVPVFTTVTPINPDCMKKVGTVGLPVENWLYEQQRLNEWIRQQPYAVDVTPKLTDSRGWLRADYTTDGLHPDYDGKRIIGQTVSSYLLQRFPNDNLLEKP